MDLSNENVIHVKNGDVEYIQFKKMLEYKNIVHAYALKPLDFRRHLENDVILSYKKLLNDLGLKTNTIVRPSQEHTSNLIVIEEKKNLDAPDIYMEYLNGIDGTLTSKKNITLASTNADCVLLMFYDTVKNVIANVHSGWRGTFKKIGKKAVAEMKEKFECNPKDILAFICPSIRACCFEVQDDVMEECKKIFNYTNRLDEIIKSIGIKEGKQKYLIDTILINKIILEEEGILPENIIDSGICSVCSSKKVHSRRADGIDYGLGTAVISMI